MPTACCCLSSSSSRDALRELRFTVADFSVVEAAANSIKLSFCLLGRSPGGFWSVKQRQRVHFQVVLALTGGPSGDSCGPRLESFIIPPGRGQIVHEISNLLSDTEYTVRLSIAAFAPPCGNVGTTVTSSAEPIPFFEEDLEVRTVASAATVATDAAASAMAVKGPDKPGPCGEAGCMNSPVGVAAALSNEELSTVAPSEEADHTIFDADQEGLASEVGDDQESAGAVFVPPVEELPPTGEAPVLIEDVEVKGIECNLYNMLDCCRKLPALSRSRQSDGAEAAGSQPARYAGADQPRTRRYRANRLRFPGVPVDPANVGLSHLATANEELLAVRIALVRAAEGDDEPTQFIPV